MTPEDIENRFDYHPADTGEKRDKHAIIRLAHRRLADYVNESVPEGREKSLAITKLEESMYWSNAAIARNKDK